MQTVTGRLAHVLMACCAACVLMLPAALLVLHPHAWSSFLAWLMTTQAELHRQLASAIRMLADAGWAAAWPLVGLSLLYGVFHAAGPGHGKAVIATYLGTSRTRLYRGLLLSLLSALMQGVVAIVLAEIVVKMLGYSLRRAQSTADHLENISFALVALVGAILTIRSAGLLYRRWRRNSRAPETLFSGNGRMQAYCADCGGVHQLTQRHLEQPLTWRTGLPIVLAIGARPCTGAILVLLVAYSLGLRWAGILSVLAMSLGTAATVSLLAVAAVSLRQGLLRIVRKKASCAGRPGAVFEALGMAGGAIIFLIGAGLLHQGLTAPSHPLLRLG